jgi:hypothetical protein
VCETRTKKEAGAKTIAKSIITNRSELDRKEVM